MQALSEASHQQTTLMVTHQLDDVSTYDQIWVMDNGKLVQRGAYTELSQQKGPFADLLATRSKEL